MKSFVHELYLNHNIYFDAIEDTPEANAAQNQIVFITNQLRKTLTKSQRRQLLKLIDVYDRLRNETAANAFSAGYQFHISITAPPHMFI